MSTKQINQKVIRWSKNNSLYRKHDMPARIKKHLGDNRISWKNKRDSMAISYYISSRLLLNPDEIVISIKKNKKIAILWRDRWTEYLC